MLPYIDLRKSVAHILTRGTWADDLKPSSMELLLRVRQSTNVRFCPFYYTDTR